MEEWRYSLSDDWQNRHAESQYYVPGFEPAQYKVNVRPVRPTLCWGVRLLMGQHYRKIHLAFLATCEAEGGLPGTHWNFRTFAVVPHHIAAEHPHRVSTQYLTAWNSWKQESVVNATSLRNVININTTDCPETGLSTLHDSDHCNCNVDKDWWVLIQL
jgi:hypothetical protein